jgi:quinol-cytochrome oxidoreductase complex cytochrome b subunit
MSGTITAKKVVTHPFFSLLCVVFLFFILPTLPRYGSMVGMVVCAGILSAYVTGLPEHFRSRSGSMMAATCLVAAMWVAAAVITALTLLGAIRD